MKKTLIVGHKGNMARRYATILDFLGKPWCGIDNGDSIPDMTMISGILIATPTMSHIDIITKFLRYNIPILCEKPISKGVIQLANFFEVVKKTGTPVQMINQYRHLIHGDDNGPTHYDYFKSGADGLAWDCINIIGLASGDVKLNYKSPIWSCAINGRQLNIREMDEAYCVEIDEWLHNPTENTDYMKKAHRKVLTYVQQSNKKTDARTDRDSGSQH